LTASFHEKTLLKTLFFSWEFQPNYNGRCYSNTFNWECTFFKNRWKPACF